LREKGNQPILGGKFFFNGTPSLDHDGGEELGGKTLWGEKIREESKKTYPGDLKALPLLYLAIGKQIERGTGE